MKIHKAVTIDKWHYTLCTHKMIAELLATKDNDSVTCKRCLALLGKQEIKQRR